MTFEQDLELARAALAVIDKVIAVVTGAKLGHVTPEAALAGLAALHSQLAGNDRVADAELAAKFDTSGT